jgi:nucleotide-binding universal stress UspA family protein
VTAEAEAAAAADGVRLTPHVMPGHEVETIVKFVKDRGFDLLVIGFMGHSRVFERIWGGTSQNLARLAPCTVLVVK